MHRSSAVSNVALSARNLQKTYKASGNQPPKQALKGIDLEVPRGSIFGLLGPNGAGKSTFINILAGLVNKTQGEAAIWGFDIDQNPRQARASIGIVPQELSIDPFFTPGEIMDIQAGLYGVPRKQRRTMEILEALGLADKADAYSRTLSGGMRRRLLVAKALVHNPPVLVLDEPTNDLDLETLDILRDTLLGFKGTLILISHDRDFLDSVVTGIWSFDPDQKLREYVGGYSDWIRQRPKASEPAEHATAEKTVSQDVKQQPPKKLAFHEKREYDALGAEIERLEIEIKALEDAMAAPDFFQSNPEHAASESTRYQSLQTELELKFLRFMELDERAN